MNNEQLQKLRAEARPWFKFVETYPYDDLNIFTPRQWQEYVEAHPDKVPPEKAGELYQSLQAADAYFEQLEAPSPTPQTPPQHFGHDASSIIEPLGALIHAHLEKRHEIKLAMEALKQGHPAIQYSLSHAFHENPNYQAMVKNLEGTKIYDWMREDPKRKWEDHEKDENLQKYLKVGIHQDAEAMFRASNQHVDQIKALEAAERKKVYKDKKGKANPWSDPVYQQYHHAKEQAIKGALERRKQDIKNGTKPKHNEYQLRKIVDLQHSAHFAQEFPEKANAYFDNYQKTRLKLIREAQEKLEKEREREAKRLVNPPSKYNPFEARRRVRSAIAQKTAEQKKIVASYIDRGVKRLRLDKPFELRNRIRQNIKDKIEQKKQALKDATRKRAQAITSPLTSRVATHKTYLIDRINRRLARLTAPIKSAQTARLQFQSRLKSRVTSSLAQSRIGRTYTGFKALKLPGLGNIPFIGNFMNFDVTSIARKAIFALGWQFWAVVGTILLIVLLTVGGLQTETATARPLPKSAGGSSGGGGSSSGSSSLGGGGNIAACTFYRGGDPISGVKIGNPTLATTIDEIASKVGVPSALVAAFLRVESGDKFIMTDPTYLANDYDATLSSAGAIGMAQFLPGTFLGIFNANKAELNSLFGKTDVVTTVDPPSAMKPNSYFRIYSIRDTITANAFFIKNGLAGAISGITKDMVTNLVQTYFSGPNKICAYSGIGGRAGDYCDDVWKSFSECQTQQQPIAKAGTAVCPIPGGKVVCGPSKPVNTNYGPACSSGHCAGNYGNDALCKQFPATAYAADIPGTPNQDVILPELSIPGETQTHSITCDYVGESPGTLNNSQITPMYSCRDDNNGKTVWIQFSHVLAGSSVKGRLRSGQTIGKVDADTLGGFPHSHVQIGINGGCNGSDPSGCIPADKYLQCK